MKKTILLLIVLNLMKPLLSLAQDDKPTSEATVRNFKKLF